MRKEETGRLSGEIAAGANVNSHYTITNDKAASEKTHRVDSKMTVYPV